MEISLGATQAELLAGRAVFLPSSHSLIVADIHLGKAATFRKRGLAVPEGSNASDLDRLQALVDLKQPKQLVIAGDLFHSADGMSTSTIESFQTWLAQLDLPVILTEGNHDRRAWFAHHKFPIEATPELKLDDLIITHDPDDLPSDQAGIAGHLHPGIRIKESPRHSLRVPGFFLRDAKHLILPAFSEFTGTQLMKADKNDRFFTELESGIVEIPHQLIRALPAC